MVVSIQRSQSIFPRSSRRPQSPEWIATKRHKNSRNGLLSSGVFSCEFSCLFVAKTPKPERWSPPQKRLGISVPKRAEVSAPKLFFTEGRKGSEGGSTDVDPGIILVISQQYRSLITQQYHLRFGLCVPSRASVQNEPDISSPKPIRRSPLGS